MCKKIQIPNEKLDLFITNDVGVSKTFTLMFYSRFTTYL